MRWAPYTGGDPQVEFVMLDPYVRADLTEGGAAAAEGRGAAGHPAGTYAATFAVPDVYGVFHFRLHYRRPGATVLHDEAQVSVRPLRQDEHERFLPAAWPYYATVAVLSAAVLLFSAAFLHVDG